jgi:hypothetical protein
MGKNTPERQDFIIENLRVELDIIDTPEEEACWSVRFRLC